MLYTYIARIRRLLAEETSDRISLRRGSDGYKLRIDPDRVDVHRFRQRIKQARRAASRNERLTLLTEALELWQGVPLSGVTGECPDSVRNGLTQLRLNALMEHIDLSLDDGHLNADLVDRLTELLAEHPSEERLVGQPMLALHRTGRTTEALAVYERSRMHLGEAFGNDPGPELQRLHQQILRQEPTLHPPTRVAAATHPKVPRQLPIAPMGFVGRATEMQAATAALGTQVRTTPPVVAIYGRGGKVRTRAADRARRK